LQKQKLPALHSFGNYSCKEFVKAVKGVHARLAEEDQKEAA